MSLGYLPEFDQKSFVESISEGFEESYLVQLGNKLHQSGSHKQTKLLITGDRQKVAVTGLGGIGKTSLALAYAHLCSSKHLYEVIHWIHAEEQSLIISSYRHLLQSLNESTKDLDDDGVRIRLNHALKDKKYLLIFDNVNSPDELQDDLEQNLLPQGDKGHIIVTSRYHSSGWDESIEMGVFSPEEAINYLFKRINAQRIIQEENDDNKEAARKIAKKLGSLPLALSQAASYIQVRECSLNDYLNKLKAQQKTSLLKFQDEKTRKKQREKTKTKKDLASIVYTTWDMTLDELDPFARQLMTYFSYLSPDDIPLSLFKDPLIDKDEETIEDIIDELKRYSMVKRSRNYVSLHRLVQMVGRTRQEEKKQVQETIETLMRLFVGRAETLFQANLDDHEECGKVLKYLPHILKLYKNAKMLKVPKNPSENLFERFEWTGLMISLIGFYDNYLRPSGKESIQEGNSYWKKKLESLLLQQDSLLEEFKGREGDEAFKWFYNIAEKSHKIIQYLIGQMYHESIVVVKNEQEAVKWYKSASDQGSADAQYMLGEMYVLGRGGLSQDDVEALKWYRFAADQGVTAAQFKLGLMHEEGRGGLQKSVINAVE